jgi:succinoglycan biosynthesis protein ExoA
MGEDPLRQLDIERPMVSVVVPMRNEEKHIERCLAALASQDYPSELLEILVVDGMSDDRSSEIVEEWSTRNPNIRLLKNEKRQTPAGLNVGIKAAAGDVIARVDAHCEIAPDYISQCVYYLEKTGADNVGGLMRPVSDTYWGQTIALSTSTPFGVGDSRFHYSQKERYVETVYMGTYRRALFDRIGLFDESLVRNQDYELNYRLRAAGGRIFCTPAIKSRYYTRPSLSALWRQYFQYGFWKSRVIRLHPASTRWRHLAAPVFVLAVFGSAILSVVQPAFVLVLALILALYLAVSLAFSASLAARHGLRYLGGLLVTFSVIHVSWGLGFWWGGIRFLLRGDREE